MHLGLVGLATMGANLARNAARNGVSVAVYNRTHERTEEFLKQHGHEGMLEGVKTLKDLCNALPAPRVILLMVKAGEAVDSVIEEVLPHLEQGDILIDGGNSAYRDTERRGAFTAKKGVRYLGLGVSGGEEGALHGPSMMPGGDRSAYDHVEPMLRLMAADDGGGGACVAYCGPGGAGHFVKMVHNGIEYGMMQIIAEAVDVLRSIGGYDLSALAETFDAWRQMPETESFLLDVTTQVLEYIDPTTKIRLLEMVGDAAGQKGTGKWTVEAAYGYRVAVPTIAAAVDARIISGSNDLRARGKAVPLVVDLQEMPPRPLKMRSLVRSALELSTLAAYQQGFELLAAASKAEGWSLDLAETARIWRGGCIIRSGALRMFQRMFGDDPEQATASRETFLYRFEGERQLEWRRTVELSVSRGVPVPAMMSALAYVDALRRDRLPQYVIQAQRDAFGAHGFARTDQQGAFHSPWKHVA